MTVGYSTTFSKRGILIGCGFLTAEYIVYSLFYSYANPEIWENTIPHKYIFYITLLMLVAVALFVVNCEGSQDELAFNANKFDDLRSDILLAVGLSIFSIGTFILSGIAKTKLFNGSVVSSFIDHNLYVSSASNWLNVINQFLYPVLVTFIFQGYILNGLTKEIGFKKSSVAVSLFYGFWFGDILGGTIYCLFLNQVYWKTKNIFYPALLMVIVNLVFILVYMIKSEIWLLKAGFPDYNSEIAKGLFITAAMSPVAYKIVRRPV